MVSALATAGVWSYLLLFAMSAAEASAFLGLAVPGETFVLAAGALAAGGLLQSPWLLVAVVSGAVVGDSIGYALGRRLGGCRESGWLARIWSCRRMDQARGALDRWGGPTVLFGRFVGLLRALVPFAAGAAQMRYRRFLAFNVIGALAWGAGTLALGYYGATAAGDLTRPVGPVTTVAVLLAVLVVGLIGRRRWRTHRRLGTNAVGSRPPVLDGPLAAALSRRDAVGLARDTTPPEAGEHPRRLRV